MTTPGQPFDAGNPLLGETPANLTTALVPSPDGQRLVLTIRTASTTLTLLLAATDAKAWAAQMSAAAAQMSTAGLVIAGGPVAR